MSILQELELDLQELEQLLKSATRTRTKKLLEEDVNSIRLQIENEKKNAPQPVQKEVKEEGKVQNSEPTQKAENFNPITKYAWDQEGKNVKVYITLDDIGKLDPSNIKFEVTKETVDLKIYQYKNSNWRFSLKKTYTPIQIEKCKFVQKANAINITLVKEKDGYWEQLTFKESSFKPEKPEKEKEQDPSASLMNMMKKLYEEGDDEMKKTISQAWTKSQDEKIKK